MMHVYYGNGKGKTTAALGLALRAAGQGFSVIIVQFLKNSPTGEESFFAGQSNVTLLRGKSGKVMTFAMSDAERAETLEIHNRNLKRASERVFSGECDILVLDEALDALSSGLLDAELLKRLVYERPEKTELVVTGHKPIDWIIEKADYVTETVKVKHPFDKGVGARRGIEY